MTFKYLRKESTINVIQNELPNLQIYKQVITSI